MLISLTSGIYSTPAIRTQEYRNGTTFQLVSELVTPSPIIIEVPTEEYDLNDLDNYTGGWRQLIQGGNALQLDADNLTTTVYGSVVIRLSKTVDEAAGANWTW